MVLPAVSKKGKSMGNLKEYSKEIKETAANLRIIDDALFRLMGEKPGVCEEILRTLLDMPHLCCEGFCTERGPELSKRNNIRRVMHDTRWKILQC